MAKSTIYNLLAFATTTFGPILYLLWHANILEDGVFQTTNGIRSIVILAAGFLAFKSLREIKKRASDVESTNYQLRAFGQVASDMMPWVVAVLIISFVHFGITNIYYHVLWISGFQITGAMFSQKEYYWRLEERNPQRPPKGEESTV